MKKRGTEKENIMQATKQGNRREKRKDETFKRVVFFIILGKQLEKLKLRFFKFRILNNKKAHWI